MEFTVARATGADIDGHFVKTAGRKTFKTN